MHGVCSLYNVTDMTLRKIGCLSETRQVVGKFLLYTKGIEPCVGVRKESTFGEFMFHNNHRISIHRVLIWV
jgi:hypothetical protein